MISQDRLWKGTVKDLIEDLILLYFGDSAEDFDLARGVDFLEQQMAQIALESDTKQRYVDVLVKIWFKNGTDAWFLIHIEIQGYADANFEVRMFIYFYRIFDRYGRRVAQLALLTDEDENYHPTKFEQQFLGTKTTHEFKVVKLAKKKAEDFSDRSNIFTYVLETAWLGLKKNRKSDEEKFNYAMQLKRNLLQGGFPKEKIRTVLRFLEHAVTFGNEEINQKMKQEIHQTEKIMGLYEYLIEDAREEGMEEGMEKGREEGMEKGMEKGREEGELLKTIAAIRKMTLKKFDPIVIADLLEVSEAFVLDIQQQLKKEAQILAQLAKPKATVMSVAKKSGVSHLLVQVIKDAAAAEASR